MKMYSVHVILVCLLCLLLCSQSKGKKPKPRKPRKPKPTFKSFLVDLRTGASTDMPDGVTWHSNLTRPDDDNCTCNLQGVLKLTFSPARRRIRAQVDLTFEYSVGHTFNIGDSVSNNGFAGDYNHQRYDAEVNSKNRWIYFFGRDKPLAGSGWSSYGKLYEENNFLAVSPYSTVTLNIANELATADNGLRFLRFDSHKLFGLAGQEDAGPIGTTNYDVYLGMNRVVHGAYRSGKGLCKVKVQFHPTLL